MASWSGFTEEEVLRLKQQTIVTTEVGDYRDNNQESSHFKTSLVPNSNTSKKRKPREKIRTRKSGSDKSCGIKSCNSSSSKNVNAAESFSANTRTEGVSISSQDIEEDAPESERVISYDKNAEVSTKTEREVPNIDEEQGIPGETIINTHEVSEVEIIEEPERIQEIELSALQKMQSKQQQMEEENKKRTVLLQQTISERFKKTQKETKTLAVVQNELKHLDSLLSADVSILRDKIEAASIDYLRAQKRYERAEAEFVAAKMDLYKKTECKEQLTEHLYVIIEANEARKAKKLAELMTKLELQEDLDHNSDSLTPLTSVEGCTSNGEETKRTADDNLPASESESVTVLTESAPEIKTDVAKQTINQS